MIPEYLSTAFLRIICGIALTACLAPVHAQHHAANAEQDDPLTEADYYPILDVPTPEHILPEIGGLARLPDGRMAMVNRRGECWFIENPSGEQPYFKLFASGLHEPLGLTYRNGALYTAQRAELTRLTDTSGDDRADRFETVTSWALSGNYCEYNHGPVIGGDGNFYVNMNLGDNGMGSSAEDFYGEMGSHAKWRGWMVRITPEGTLSPFASGLRSPAGIGTNAAGELFYTENQGGWVGTGYIAHVEEGDFFGHPSSLKSAGEPESNNPLRPADIPRDAPLFHEAVKRIQGLKMPSVRIPHGILGISTAGLIADPDGAFGPFFRGQLFVGDEGHANLMRVFLEKVNGEYQGAVFPFRQGFASGILRLEWGADSSLFVGMSDRGWSSTGSERQGLQRLVWSGKTPFEIRTIKAMPDGFELEFTLPVDPATAENPAHYQLSSFDYRYHQTYGSDVEDQETARIRGIRLAADGLSARLILDTLRAGYIYEIKCGGLRSQQEHLPLLHDFAYYSLNAIPGGDKISVNDPDFTWIPDEPAPEKTGGHSRPETKPAGATPGKATALAKHTTRIPASWTDGPDQTITIGTKPGLQYDIKQIDLRPGAKVELVFNNNDDMQHNLLVVEPGSADQVGEQALKLGLDGPSMQYVPESDQVLYHTSLLQPRSSETIYFTAPDQPGQYEYVCTYPGHYLVMRGTITIKSP